MNKSKRLFAALRPCFGPVLTLKLRLGFIVLLLGLSALGYAAFARRQAAAASAGQESPDGIWRSQPADAAGLSQTPDGLPQARVFQLNEEALRNLLSQAPLESPEALTKSPIMLTAPRADGSFARFRLVESPIMEPGLAAQFPRIKTYLGQGIDDPTATMRCDLTPQGFHASVFSAEGSFFVEPVKEDARNYHSYFKQGRGQEKDWQCFTNPAEAASPASPVGGPFVLSGATLRTYRLALAATGEYTAFHGGTVAGALAAMVTSMNRVNGVYEREVGVRMVLVANTNLVIYTDAGSDPYTNSSGSAMLGQNQTTLDQIIGSANYDIGHVFSTGGGGVASLRSVCTGSKARGVTGSGSPVGDGFDIDYVAHEMGHQFGGNHTFNGTTSNCSGNRAASAAYEPGSASTIMGYAGICAAENLQPNSDAYFHVKSIEEILAHINGTGNCAVSTPTGNNPPTVSAGNSFTIPQGTPFKLTASGSDPDGDALTFCWEQYDLGTAAPPNTDNGNRPIFRSFTGTANPARTFPRLSDILNNTLTIGESLQTTTRALNFRVTARDNRAGGGGVRDASVAINSRADSGPFLVTAPNSAITWPGNSLQNVTWSVANTDAAPVSCAQVNILLSLDGGNTFPITLLANAPNNGSASVTVPNAATTQARIKIEAVGNIFFDISNSNFSITAGAGGCSYTLNPTSQNFSAAGGANTVSVIADAGCVWTSFSNSPWITINGGTSGIGNGTVNYTVMQNATGAMRTGSMTIASQSFTVTQSGGTGGLQFYPLPRPIRLLDTRAGFSGCDAPQVPIPGNIARTQTARRTCDGLTIPLNAAAITGNITTVQSGGGFLTLYPSDATQPNVANSNYNPNEILNNVFTVGLGNADGAFKILVTSTTHVVVDVTGYYAPPAAGGLYFHPLPKPVRLLETRAGFAGCFMPGAPLPGNTETTQQARGQCEGLTIPNAALAITGNATTANTAGTGPQFMTLFPADATRPLVANSNYLPGQVMNAPFTVGLSTAGSFKIYPTSQTDLVVDVLGYYSTEATDVNGTGLLFNPLPKPVRLLETRAGFSGCFATGTPLLSGSTRTQTARGVCDGATITTNALGLVGNATVVNATGANGNFLTFWPSDATQPTVATSNFAAGQVFNRHFTVGLGASDGAFKIFTQFQTDLVIDVSGFFAP